METVLDRPPRTIMEVFKILPEGTRAELIDNIIYMSPAPLFNHQDVLLEIAQQFRQFFKKKNNGKAIIAPFDVYLDETSNAVQPDITVILNSNAGKLKGQFHGVPDLIVEIISPGSVDHDRVVKKKLYEKFKVPEYWLVDPETKKVTGYSLKDGAYILIEDAQSRINSPLLQSSFEF